MRKRIYKLVSALLLACMVLTGSGVTAYAESEGEVEAETDVEMELEEESTEEVLLEESGGEPCEGESSDNENQYNVDLQKT